MLLFLFLTVKERRISQMVAQHAEYMTVNNYMANYKGKVDLLPVIGDGFCSAHAVKAVCDHLNVPLSLAAKTLLRKSVHAIFEELLCEIGQLVPGKQQFPIFMPCLPYTQSVLRTDKVIRHKARTLVKKGRIANAWKDLDLMEFVLGRLV
jgi:hypothetical protein